MKYKDYSIESRRLATFDLWPDNSPVPPRLLAIAGFFCVDENTVVCFDCGGQFRNWKAGDNPFVRHVSEQKDCEFAKNLQVSQASTSNVPNNDAMQGQAQQAVMESTTPSSNSWLHHSHNFNSNELYESHHTLCDSQCPKDLNTDRLPTYFVDGISSDQPPRRQDTTRFTVGSNQYQTRNLNTERDRLTTYFDWPRDVLVSPEDLARLGFFYLGYRDRVECAFCGGVLHQWEAGDDPFIEHQRHYPHCPFVNGEATANVQLGETSPQASPPTSSPSTAQNIVTSQTSQQPSTQATGSGTTSAYALPIDRQWPRMPDFADEDSRLSTFHNWPRYSPMSPLRLARAGFLYTCKYLPSDVPVSPEDLARQGFVYLGYRDRVECAFSGGVLHQWEEGDDPVVEHQRHYPDCPFVRGLATSNIPLDDDRHLHVPVDKTMASAAQRMFCPSSTGVAETDDGFLGQTRQPELSSEHTLSRLPPRAGVSYTLPIEAQRPRMPDFADEESRLSTFHKWPLYSPISPRRLAQAGFVYTCIDDQVRCFWCEGGLKDWLQGDDPWEEHARWYGPECGYVIMRKGMDYIWDIRTRSRIGMQQTRQQGTQQHVSYREGISTAIPEKQLQQNRSSHQRNLEQQVNDAMDSRIVRDAVEMGFDPDDIRRVVYCQINEHGQFFATMTGLIKALLDAEEDEDLQDQPPREESPPKETRPNPSTETQEQPLDLETMEHMLRRLRRLREERQCKVCLSEDACMVFIPCGHLCCCEHCANMLRIRGRRCPLCRAMFQRVQRAFHT
ncbi:PREDICTED: E3 ubiquitin-protein ligase XIAP-like [Branchiostoma belcheri]|uniref:RING-type E3 ubiquitin transferase n=1 Tax=Branchiostoma belcheri TaxID=7741 RepID=A0A6P5A527_BRABE|nr:PREDICTED: E3 ubiquitin-protein ligase XIAP-like [Branchiostoma belcheri]